MEIHMNTKTSTSPANAAFKSLSDSAYQQAGATQTIEDVARYVIEKVKGYPTDLPSEAKEKLVEGYRMRFAQNNKPKAYAVINDHYVLATPEHMATKNVEKIEVGVDYAFSYSSQEFGKLANTQPALHKLVKDIRDKCSSYCSNRLNDLKRKAKEILNEGKPRERTANKNFGEFVEAWFKDVALERLISTKARGDATADSEKFNKAAAAFLTVWKK
jgi:hypothetical protein